MGISLEKKLVIIDTFVARRNIPDTRVEVKACVDISGSMMGLFNNGTVQEVIDRMLAVGVRFDDNQSIEMYAYGSGAVRLDDVTPAMFGNYVNQRFLPQAQKSGHLWSGTSYASALNLVSKDMKAPMFGFGKKKKPAYLMFITDGQTSDTGQTEKLIEKLGEQNVYVQLIGVGHDDFSFLKRMGDKYEHVGYVTLPNLASMDDEQLYNELLTDELATWLRRF